MHAFQTLVTGQVGEREKKYKNFRKDDNKQTWNNYGQSIQTKTATIKRKKSRRN
jgi:hypothetical protein